MSDQRQQPVAHCTNNRDAGHLTCVVVCDQDTIIDAAEARHPPRRLFTLDHTRVLRDMLHRGGSRTFLQEQGPMRSCGFFLRNSGDTATTDALLTPGGS
jgi:hypothetical protein